MCVDVDGRENSADVLDPVEDEKCWALGEKTGAQLRVENGVVLESLRCAKTD